PLKRVSKAERPKVRAASKPRVLSHEELEALLAHVSDAYRPLIATAAFSGMRLSELLGLRWQDVDLDEGLIRVRHQLSRAKRGKPARLLPLKTDAAARDIFLLPQLAALLRKHKAHGFSRGFAKPEDYVFTTSIGTPINQRNVSARGLEKAADRAGLNRKGLPRVSMHDLRHTFASHLILDVGLDMSRCRGSSAIRSRASPRTSTPTSSTAHGTSKTSAPAWRRAHSAASSKQPSSARSDQFPTTARRGPVTGASSTSETA
ncbi:MAG: tyrosine-type recombinase/integrase, partial [Pseudomonadota bacterium]